MKKPVVTVYARHRSLCSDAHKGEFYRGCNCPKWLRFSLNGKRHRQPTGTATWGLAEEKAHELQKQLDSGRYGMAVTDTPAPVSHHQTIAGAIQTFIRGKESENLSSATIRKLRYQLNMFEQFMTSRSKFYPADITAQDVIDYRATWTWSDLTKIKAQSNLRGFIQACCKGNHRTDLLDALGKIKETKQGKERRKPKPFTEEEIENLLAKVPVVFADDPEKIPSHQTMIRLMVSTGLAIVDTVQLERAALERAKKTGVLEVERQKTNKPATIPISTGLLGELLAVMNGNPKYVFWHGAALADSETKRLQGEMRDLMKAAGVYIKGNVYHRFRDTAVDFWIGQGWSLTDVATALGDTVTVVEKHYKDWASQRMKERLAKLPVREWEAN
ncbi:MAG: hypothetical protein DMG96_38390 [Acidobacteria bacterium]|nr:MAG: hypothetical protein DMG96_38390 [Acidobacteriota bacterium]HEU0046891.1 tyrosine-type recombinase/integrase [Nitrososphaera sp.]